MFLAFFIHDGLRANLFLSIANKAMEKDIGFRIYCFSLKEYIWFKSKGVSLKNLKLIKQIVPSEFNVDLSKSIDVAAQFLTLDNASKIFNATLHALEDLELQNGEKIIFSGNGLHAFDKAIDFYRKSNLDTFVSYSELANIDGKVFFDSFGSNASSYFYKIIKNGNIQYPDYDAECLQKWKRNYYENKIKNHFIRQTPKKNIKNSLYHRAIGILEFIFRVPSYQRFKIEELLFQRKRKNQKLYASEWEPFTDFIAKDKHFIFFPLQVFGDSQIKLHSSINIEDALKYVALKAKEMGMTLVVKPHPAEPDKASLRKVVKLKEMYGFLLTTKNTFELIQQARKVVVINSTVGLEAIICGKEVEFLGDSFYKYFSDDRILNFYINHWLINIDIFKEAKLSDSTFLKIIHNAKLQ